MKKPITPHSPNSIREGQPAAYPDSTVPEMDSVTLLLYLLNKTHIKGEIKTLDKNPNGDGILEYTTKENIPIGKFEVQVKTLTRVNYDQPKHQCKKSFLSHCYHTNLPVILISVNNTAEKAYWLHVNSSVLDDAQIRIKKNTVMIPFPAENVISKTELAYIGQWEKIVRDDVALRQQALAMRERHDRMEVELAEIRSKLEAPLTLNTAEIRSFQLFLDAFNGLLDREFKAFKAVRYPDYWKIGIGMVRKTEEQLLLFFLLPIPYGSSEALIRQMDVSEPMKDLNYFLRYDALMLVSRDQDTLERHPLEQSYKLLSSEIMRVMKNHYFPLADDFLAGEFISTFVDTFRVWLGLDSEHTVLTLAELRELITTVMPVVTELSFSFIREGTTELDHTIDSDKERNRHPNYRKRILEAREKLSTGYTSAVRVRLHSQLFPIPLLLYYIDHLLALGHTGYEAVYQGGQTRFQNVGLMPSGWNKPVLFENLRRFFVHFPGIYQRYIATHFPLLQKELGLFVDCQLVVFVLMTTGPSAERPHLQCYRLQQEDKSLFGTAFFLDTDDANPIKKPRETVSRIPPCHYEGRDYTAVSMTVMVIDFIFEWLPTYSLVHKQLLLKMETYLRQKERRS